MTLSIIGQLKLLPSLHADCFKDIYYSIINQSFQQLAVALKIIYVYIDRTLSWPEP